MYMYATERYPAVGGRVWPLRVGHEIQDTHVAGSGPACPMPSSCGPLPLPAGNPGADSGGGGGQEDGGSSGIESCWECLLDNSRIDCSGVCWLR